MANCSGVPPATSAPALFSLSITSAERSRVLSSRFRRCTISGGVPAGAKTPNQLLNSMPGTPISVKVGTLGIDASRRAPVTASGRTRPPLMCGCADTTLSIRKAICPAMRSVTTSPVPR